MQYDLSDYADIVKFELKVSLLKRKRAKVDLIEKNKIRTTSQNSSIHLYCEMIAVALNDMGHTFSYLGVKGITLEIPYTMELVKATMWKPIQDALFGKKSTTELTTSEVSEVAAPLVRFFAERDIDLPFPSMETKQERYAKSKQETSIQE